VKRSGSYSDIASSSTTAIVPTPCTPPATSGGIPPYYTWDGEVCNPKPVHTLGIVVDRAPEKGSGKTVRRRLRSPGKSRMWREQGKKMPHLTNSLANATPFHRNRIRPIHVSGHGSREYRSFPAVNS
jgi:hypothetical protein